jgi:hypothetical protein
LEWSNFRLFGGIETHSDVIFYSHNQHVKFRVDCGKGVVCLLEVFSACEQSKKEIGDMILCIFESRMVLIEDKISLMRQK